MNPVLFAGLFVFASAVLGENKGRIASVILVPVDMHDLIKEAELILTSFVV